MQTQTRSKASSASRRMLVIAAALIAADLALCAASAYAGETPGAVTISLSGSTAMRAFTTSASITSLTPGRSITLDNGYTYTANNVDVGNGIFPAVQLGANVNDTYPVSNPLDNANYRAMRVEWHEQGSVEGIMEMANDQIGTIGTVSTFNRNPSVGNPVWVNGVVGGTLTAPGTNAGGYTINTSTYNTYSATNYNLATGSNLLGGQNRVQMAISDVTTKQGFAFGGTTATGAWNKTPGQVGYGKGNAALASAANVSGVGVGGARQQLNDQTVLNMSTDKIDPQTGTNYTAGAWNTAGVNNVNNTTVAITATTFAANPGTGLTKVNRTDAQFLQATGRLANGADFNVVTRDVGSGTRNVASLNVGLDPSFSVGENDDGNTGTVISANDPQQVIGSGIRFSGKTAGGNGLRPTVQNSRMAIGHLSISDIRSGTAAGTTANPNAGARPIRALAYRDDANDTSDASNATLQGGFADPASGAFVKPSFDSITDGSYALYQNETYATVKVPDAVKYNQDVIKGDNTGNDVRDFRDNILASAAAYPASSSFLNPANGLINNGFIPTQYMKVRKDQDGLNQSVANTTFDAANFPTIKSQATSAFDVGDAASVTTGTGSTYGAIAAASGGIAITANNYLFGDFDNDGDRDFADIKLAAAAQASLQSSGAGTTYITGSGATNNQIVPGLTGALATMTGYDGSGGAKKGDLIVKGDFNSDGKFDGKDIYLLAHGASLADNTSTDTLTAASGATFGDQLRNGTLRKNAALDYLNVNATAQQKVDATASTANDPTGANAFNKFDVNRDGVINRTDAAVVDHFVGNRIDDLGQQIAATIAVDGSLSTSLAQRSLSLVDVELQDNVSITATLANGSSDFKLIRDALGTLLKDGDTDFNGSTNFNDLLTLAKHYTLSTDRWSDGDFNLDGVVNFDDLLGLARNYDTTGGSTASFDPAFAADWTLARGLAPEPTALLALTAAGTLGGRRRRKI